MRVVEYTPEMLDQWEGFVESSANGTIFHLQRFLNYHPPGRFRHRHLMFYEGKKLVALVPGVDWQDGKRRVYISHRGASYGGFVIPEGFGIKDAMEVVGTLLWWCKNKEYRELILTQTPQIYYSRPHNHIDFALMRNGATFVKRELTSVIELKSSIDENFAMFRSEARTATRKAMRNGVEVRLSDDFPEFYRILEKNLAMRHNVSPTHTLEELLLLRSFFPNRIMLWGAYYKGNLIAGVVIFITNPRALLAFYISHDERHQHLRPLNLLFYSVIKWGIENRFRYLDFGTYTLNMEPNFGLANFKEGFGALGYFRDTYRVVL